MGLIKTDQGLFQTDSPTFAGLTIGDLIIDDTQSLGAGQDGYVMSWDDGAGKAVFIAAAGGGDVVDDTTPKLGGDLSLNSFKITESGQTVATSDPMVDLTQTWNGSGVEFDAVVLDITDTDSDTDDSNFINFKNGGTTVARVNVDGRFIVQSGTSVRPSFAFGGNANERIGFYESVVDSHIGVATGGGLRHSLTSNSIRTRDTNSYSWVDSNNPSTGTVDLSLFRGGAGILEQRDGINAQSNKIFGTYTDDSNGEWVSVGHDGSNAEINLTSNGTGSTGNMLFQRDGANYLGLLSNSSVTCYTSLYPSGNGTINLGWSSLRWIGWMSDIDVSGTLTIGSNTIEEDTELFLNTTGLRIETQSGSGSDFRAQVLDGGSTLDIYAYAGNTSPRIRMGGDQPGIDEATVLWHAEGGGVNNFNLGDRNSVIEFQLRKGSSGGMAVRGVGYYAWGSSSANAQSPDTFLYRDAAYTISQRNGVNAQLSRLYNTFTDASNNEYLELGFDTDVAVIRTVGNGTGTKRNITLDPSTVVSIGTAIDLYGTAGQIIFKTGRVIKSTNNNTIRIQDSISNSTGTPTVSLAFGCTMNDSDAVVQTVTDITPTYNQTGSAGGVDLKINRTETALGSGTHRFFDCQVSGSSKFSIVNDGQVIQDLSTDDKGFINFKATTDADATSAISTLTTSGAVTHHIQIEINGVKAWIPVSTTDPS